MRGSLVLQPSKLSLGVLGSSTAHSRQLLQVCLSEGCIPLQHGNICLFQTPWCPERPMHSLSSENQAMLSRSACFSPSTRKRNRQVTELIQSLVQGLKHQSDACSRACRKARCSASTDARHSFQATTVRCRHSRLSAAAAALSCSASRAPACYCIAQATALGMSMRMLNDTTCGAERHHNN